jgi:hypothetical protein
MSDIWGQSGFFMFQSQSHRFNTARESEVIVFPLQRQRRQIEDLARRLARKRSQQAADRECAAVADAMFARLAALGLSEAEQDEAVGAFFHEVDCEVDRLVVARIPGCGCCKEA